MPFPSPGSPVTGDHAGTGQRTVGLEAMTSIDGVDLTGPTSGDGCPECLGGGRPV
jgi:hypothetical protein